MESAADLLPRVMLQDLDRTIEELLRTELAAIGCTVQGRAEQVDVEPPDLLIMKAGSEPVTRAAVTMAVVPEDAPDIKLPPGVIHLEEPDTVVSVMEAVAGVFWSREPMAFMGLTADGSGRGEDS